ncbi:MFS transporter [Mycobacterium kansasii]|uniref:Major facilitator transporter n=3 Tax=Mycobacterium kansasii TaxID=1768 RepID=U5X081_MYCKA|nr:MFS transporter [Mycobacterium kansasii]ETZ98151.1 putative multidrug-efflux transporter [Mycobacterium kansasii 824]AGZ53730.1 major facilitator transporter [Mycobacterium kansasii ATCC 12478]ARG54688.1 MFS transporter [Mycobacterium kansasii]ARG60140.1 MFS transporter [Mycobacterium kansasii]ARG67878.1 MFS transporter [Mycobacterium kansasii]
MTETASETGSWSELLSRHLGTATMLAGGVALYATNEFLTISLLPSTIAEIGGSRLYAWVTTLYLVGSVVAATSVNPMLLRVGARTSYLMGLTVFGVASLLCAAAPNMEALVAGRTLQGVAGGLLAGLGYALINAALPHRLWTRGSALVSAMWGVATLVGPATGGLFAQFGLWRWAFAAMAVMSGLMAVLVLAVLSSRAGTSGGQPVTAAHKVPVWSLLLMGAAALAVSVAELPRYPVQTAGLLAASVLLIGIFVLVDWRMHVAVLPHSVFGPGPLKWIYLTMSVQMVAAMVTTYVPLFGQRLGNLTPVAAGFLGASLAVGWTASEIVSASVNNTRVIAHVVAAAPLVMASGLALGAVTQRADAPPGVVALWALALLITGTGIGIAWPHLSAWAMDSVDDPAESGAAAAAINIVQLISAAFGAGLAGVVVNRAEGGEVTAARWLFALFTVLAALGFIASYQATQRRRRSPG